MYVLIMIRPRGRLWAGRFVTVMAGPCEVTRSRKSTVTGNGGPAAAPTNVQNAATTKFATYYTSLAALIIAVVAVMSL